MNEPQDYLHSLSTDLRDVPAWVSVAICLALSVALLWTIRYFARSLSAWAAQLRAAKRQRRAAAADADGDTKKTVPGAAGFYIGAVAAMTVSLDTSWRFFGDKIKIENSWEHAAIFAVLDICLLACGLGMRASVRKHGTPGPARYVAWILCGFSAYMAWDLSGLWTGIARIMCGPLLGLIMLHLALGIEARGLEINKNSTLFVVLRELQQRLLATLGLGNDQRDAKAIIRDRARKRASHIRMIVPTLRERRWAKWRIRRAKRQFVRQLAKADVMSDPESLRGFLDLLQLASNVENVWEAQFAMPASIADAIGNAAIAPRENLAEATADAPALGVGAGEAPGEADTPEEVDDVPVCEDESIDEASDDGEASNEVDIPEEMDEVRDDEDENLVSIRPRRVGVEGEVELLLNLMVERGGARNVSLEDAKEQLRRPTSTSGRRLKSARRLYDERFAS